MIQPADILVSLQDSELKLRQIAKAGNPKLHERESRELLNRLRKGYQTLIVQHVDFLYGIGSSAKQPDNVTSNTATKTQRDIAGMLWKTCFYTPIAEFRSALKKHTARLALLPAAAPAGQGGQRPDDQRERLYVAQLTEAFLKFLSESVAFYQKLMSELEERARVRGQMPADAYRAFVNSVYRCLLYLGDLARYKEMYAERVPKDFAEALRYYERAALIEPASGNAQNQLAVLATYGDAPVVAAYHYCRSILARTPFSGGFENLAQMLDKNSAAFHHLPPPAAATGRSAPGGPKLGRKAKAAHVGDFLTRFLHVHGLLFEWSAEMHQSYAQLLSSAALSGAESGPSARPLWLSQLPHSARSQQSATQHSSGSGAARHPAEHDGFLLVLRTALDEFEEHVGTGNLPDVLLVQLLAVSLFSVHFAVGRDASMLGWTEDLSSREGLERYLRAHGEHARTTTESLALQALFGLITRAAVRVQAAVAGSERGCRAVLSKALPMLAVFGTWAQQYSHYLSTRAAGGHTILQRHEESALHATDVAPPSMFQDSAASTPQLPGSASSQDWEDTHLASVDLERAEVRTRSALRAALASLRPVLEADRKAVEQSAKLDDSGGNILAEHVELRGFLPVAAAVEASFSDFDPLCRAVTLMSEERARCHRLTTLIGAIGAVCCGPSSAERAVDSRPVGREDKKKVERASKATARSDRGERKGETTESDLPRPSPPSAVRGPPARAESVAVYDQAGIAQACLPPSAEDFPSLPSKQSLFGRPPLTVVSEVEGTGTQVDEASADPQLVCGLNVNPGPDPDLDVDLGETVVFKSAFVRSQQNQSATSLSGTHYAILGSENELLLKSTGAPEFGGFLLPAQRSTPASRAQSQDDFFARLSLPPLADPPSVSFSGLHAGLGGLWGQGASSGDLDAWAIGHGHQDPSSVFAAPLHPAQPAHHFDIFSYLDADAAPATTGFEESLTGDGTGLLLSAWNSSVRNEPWKTSGAPSPLSSFVSAPAPPGPPGLTSVGGAGGSTHSSNSSLAGLQLPVSAKARRTLPPPGLG